MSDPIDRDAALALCGLITSNQDAMAVDAAIRALPVVTPAPVTLTDALALPEVKALVEAAEYVLDGVAIDAPTYDIDPEEDFLDAANSKWVKDTLTRLSAAMRRIAEGGE